MYFCVYNYSCLIGTLSTQRLKYIYCGKSGRWYKPRSCNWGDHLRLNQSPVIGTKNTTQTISWTLQLMDMKFEPLDTVKIELYKCKSVVISPSNMDLSPWNHTFLMLLVYMDNFVWLISWTLQSMFNDIPIAIKAMSPWSKPCFMVLYRIVTISPEPYTTYGNGGTWAIGTANTLDLYASTSLLLYTAKNFRLL